MIDRHQVLRDIAPESFLEESLKLDVGSNVILKVLGLAGFGADAWSLEQANNIKRLLKELDAYYRETFRQEMDVNSIDSNAVARGEAEAVPCSLNHLSI